MVTRCSDEEEPDHPEKPLPIITQIMDHTKELSYVEGQQNELWRGSGLTFHAMQRLRYPLGSEGIRPNSIKGHECKKLWFNITDPYWASRLAKRTEKQEKVNRGCTTMQYHDWIQQHLSEEAAEFSRNAGTLIPDSVETEHTSDMCHSSITLWMSIVDPNDLPTKDIRLLPEENGEKDSRSNLEGRHHQQETTNYKE
ncbi:hypothetical protein ANN_02677 [Periplaneta americana]|uniref:Uncharacterized protein n=1 Tax=Periplaneta americana TaxID=6978 RepID=A0ABQ8TZV5_PERAM|nr:hypothetical protein ANN_02677 [Periplaneta americana]